MNNRNDRNMRLASPGMAAVLTAQFFCALGDNSALITGIAILKSQGLAGLVHLLQGAYIVPFILLAPFVGQIADAFPKGRVMLASNLVKFSGALAMALGGNPVTAYFVVGIGDAMYSPAKYGILAQMFRPALLVRANGMMEGSTIIAGLAGAVLAGWLADRSLAWAYTGVMACYGLAAVINLFIPLLRAENAGGFHPWSLMLTFWASLYHLFRNADARFSLLGTSLFWGTGITLRLMLFAWVPVALMTTDNHTPANLMAAIAIGIVLGAGAAGLWITLESVNRALLGCLLLGPVILGLAAVHSLLPAVLVMIAIGICGGLFVVPLNALLQEHGHKTIGAGRALAVQNFSEKTAMLLFVSLYGAATQTHVPVVAASVGFGLLLVLLVGLLAVLRLRQGGLRMRRDKT
jgi:LPLT family lysophospholipid transporter-like MFS transporter